MYQSVYYIERQEWYICLMIKTDLRPSSITRMPIANLAASSFIMATNWRKSRTLALETQICLRATCRLRHGCCGHPSESDDASTGHRVVMLDIEVDSSKRYPNIEKPKQPIAAIALYDTTANIAPVLCWTKTSWWKVRPIKTRPLSLLNTKKTLLMAFLTRVGRNRSNDCNGMEHRWFRLPLSLR